MELNKLAVLLFVPFVLMVKTVQADHNSAHSILDSIGANDKVRLYEKGTEPDDVEIVVEEEVAQTPKEIYESYCGAACHNTGVAGAPVPGQPAWQERIAKGKATLVQSAINGIGTMQPKGGFSNLSDETIEQIVDYMMTQ